MVNTYCTPTFYYKGDFYYKHTEITLKDEYIKTHTYNGKKIWKYAKYSHRNKDALGRVTCVFSINKYDWYSCYSLGLETPKSVQEANKCAAFFEVLSYELESAIEEITKPIIMEREQTEAILDAIANPETYKEKEPIGLWVMYIAVMIGSLIFNQFYLIWIAATILFIWLKSK